MITLFISESPSASVFLYAYYISDYIGKFGKS